MPIKIEKLFPTKIALGSLAGTTKLNRDLLKDIQTFSKEDKMGQEWSRENYRGGYTSYASLSDCHFRSPAFTAFAEALQPEAEKFAREQGWNLKGMQLVMNACWFNIMPENTYHTLHLHPHSVISGAYYVSAPKDSVALKIEDPRMGFYMQAPIRDLEKDPRSNLYYSVSPKAGNFVLFESWLRHEVPPNTSKMPRVSISFNYSLEPTE